MKVKELKKQLNEKLKGVEAINDYPDNWETMFTQDQAAYLLGDVLEGFELPDDLSFERSCTRIVYSSKFQWGDHNLLRFRLIKERKRGWFFRKKFIIKSIWYDLAEGIDGEMEISEWVKSKHLSSLKRYVKSTNDEISKIEDEIRPLLEVLEELRADLTIANEELAMYKEVSTNV